ncbi:hypothetical protein A0J61_09614 [Choanephora cucurbitarum]|uniref:Uncharacterized protein n=1 Tax=Choanephora cucurbitarum TaxID=101091 RepID=A0A1C7MZL6_9FUNG|nr:hypothetical protein A0J61_09614 [Choanephora cucurbitarum]
MAETTGEDGSWLKKRSSVFSATNSSTNNAKPVGKPADKELARLKTMGAVSSVWTNKFVQEDSGNSTTGGTRRSFVLPKSPEKTNSPRARGSTSSISSVIDTQENQVSLRKPSRASSSSLELNSSTEEIKSTRSSIQSTRDDISTARSSISSVKSQPKSEEPTTKANSLLGLHKPTKSSDEHETEAASLWFQAETLKTQLAQSNARLSRANEDIEFYKRQLEASGQSIAEMTEEKDKELRHWVDLVLKQDQLLSQYELHLEDLKEQSDSSAPKEDTTALRKELDLLYKQKDQMEGTITSLRAELEMSSSQMQLMMTVSTEIQNEFQSYKQKVDAQIKEVLKQKQAEHDAELEALKLSLNGEPTQRNVGTAVAAAVVGATVATGAVVAQEDPRAQIEKAVAEATAHHEQELDQFRQQIITLTELLHANERSGAKEAELREQIDVLTEQLHAKENAVDDHDAALETLREQIITLTTMLHDKDKAVQDLENQLKVQKRTMDAQVMELTQTILEKDSLLMEQSNNRSRETIIPNIEPHAASSAPSVSETEMFYQSSQHQDIAEARLQMAQVQQYMYSSSEDGDEEDEVEVLRMSYSSDEEEDRGIHRHSFHSQHLIASNDHHVPHSPADTISSNISYDSSDDEYQQEKIAEIKHFSYSSQATRPVSLVSGEHMMLNDENRRLSQRSSSHSQFSHHSLHSHHSHHSNTPTRFSLVKETSSASWPMPPPTPPPSEPLPPVPIMDEKSSTESTIATNSIIPPPRRTRSKTMSRSDAPNMSLYTTSIHQTNELPRIMPEAQQVSPHKERHSGLFQSPQEEPHTKWMDDPESEEDDLWCEPKPRQEWGTATAM